MSDDDEGLDFSPETQAMMLKIVGLANQLGNEGLERRIGVNDQRSFIAGMFIGGALMMGAPMPVVLKLILDPTVQALLQGIDE